MVAFTGAAGSVDAATVLRLVSAALQDLEPGQESRWPWEGGADSVGLLDFLNAALRDVALYRPDLCAVTEPIRLEPGMTQRLPRRKVHESSRDAIFLMELVRNMGADGARPGAGITFAPRELLLAWQGLGRWGGGVESYCYDRAVNPDAYYVYPAVPERGDVWVEATYAAPLPELLSPEQPLPLPGEYAPALAHHVLASVLSGDNESASLARGTYHRQLFESLMGVRAKVDAAWPRTRNPMTEAGHG